MKNIFRHIAVFLLAGVVFFSTTGLSVHHLYCFCKGETVTSIFTPENTCESHEELAKDNCCKGGSCHLAQTESRHNCTTCVTEFVRLDAQFILPALGFDLAIPAPQLPVYSLLEASFVENQTGFTWTQDISPPAGMELLRLIQSFLC